MISNEAFVLSLAMFLSGLVIWAFKRLPDERWQFLASVPIMKDASGSWHGLNFTYYGLLTANALVFGVALLIILFGALHVPTVLTLAFIVSVLVICLPAARWVAMLVEGKQCTFTIAGAFFVGIFVAPFVLYSLNTSLPWAGYPAVPIVPALAALMIAYAFGEGLGRLACISFGCCYGVALLETHPFLRRVFDRWHFVFSGSMKKISYASGLEGKQVVPIQAITCLLYIGVGLAATLLFLNGRYALAFISSMAVTQGWRIFSEVLRADYRGDGKITAYQVMGILAIVFAVALTILLPVERAVVAQLAAGIESIWRPEVFLMLQAIWAVVFVMFGKSMVTGAHISFHLHHDRI
jgi:hypothetical protein